MDIITTNLHIGLAAPITLLHISDTHLTLADERENERKLTLAASRSRSFPHAETMLTEATKL